MPSRVGQEFLSVPQTAQLLGVAPRTVHNWIKQGTVPYIELPGTGRRRQYRIPIQALRNSLSGNYDVREHLTVQTDRARQTLASEARPGVAQGNPAHH